jgi:hypothetical protein
MTMADPIKMLARSGQPTHRVLPAPRGIGGRLLGVLRALCERFDRLAGFEPAAAHERPGDPWNAGYRAGRRAGCRRATWGDDDDRPMAARAPHPERSAAASLWHQGFMIGFCDGAEERA